MYINKNLIDITETIKATIIPVNKTPISMPVNLKPNFTNFNALAPNITGIDKKNEYSVATKREAPKIIPPTIVAPDLEVPGINASIWKKPISKAVVYDNSWKL